MAESGDLQIDEYAFEQRFRPLRDSSDSWIDFDWTLPADREAITRATDARCIWTTLDVDGFVMLASGWHFVNRLGYVITEVPVPDGVDVLVYDAEELEEWEERLREAEELGVEYPWESLRSAE